MEQSPEGSGTSWKAGAADGEPSTLVRLEGAGVRPLAPLSGGARMGHWQGDATSSGQWAGNGHGCSNGKSSEGENPMSGSGMKQGRKVRGEANP